MAWICVYVSTLQRCIKGHTPLVVDSQRGLDIEIGFAVFGLLCWQQGSGNSISKPYSSER